MKKYQKILDLIFFILLVAILPYYNDNLQSIPSWATLILYLLFIWGSFKIITIIGPEISKKR